MCPNSLHQNIKYGRKTLDLDLSGKQFADEVTLLFSTPLEIDNQVRILCTRVLNNDMSNVIQEEDTHIYKDSGDNYLFMIQNNRSIPQGMAISRSRFEDKTFIIIRIWPEEFRFIWGFWRFPPC